MTLEELKKETLANSYSDEYRADLRQGWTWETCFNAWLDSESPKVVETSLEEANQEKLLRKIDQLAGRLLISKTSNPNHNEVEWIEANFPYPEDWEDSEPEDDILPEEVREKAVALYESLQEADSEE